MTVKPTLLIAKSVLIEAVRRREVYAVVLVSTLLIGLVMTVRFFGLEGLSKFYREIALKVMGIATALTVVVLASRQLPREFETRTIYPLLAKPISRTGFLLGKLLGVLLGAGFCFALFMAVFLAGTWVLGGRVPWVLFLQHVYLQMLMLLVLATLCFWLSMILHLDAAITIGVLLFLLAATFTTVTSTLYDFASPFGRALIVGLTYVIPQLALFDLSEKAVHGEAWEPLRLPVMAALTAYAAVYTVIHFSLALLSFRRRSL
ncbi:MAG: ABC transporter permease subunit [Candidatus Sumerlaeia bacterium]|nr:ABC transporter permease subunit [Candidatus Sumerlaeia bacterium]